MENTMAMTLEEAKRLTNKRLAEQRKGYLAENAYRQSPEGIKKDKDRMKAIGEGILSFTPVATVQDGSSMVDNIQKGNYQDATVDGLSAALGLTGLKPIAKMAGSAFKGLKGLFAGPLSPQYNSDGGVIYASKGAAKDAIKRFLRNMDKEPKKEPAPLQVKRTEKQLADNIYKEKGFESRDAHVAAALDNRLPSFKYQPDSRKKQILAELNEGVATNKGLTIKQKKSDNEFIAEVYSPTLKIRVPVMLNKYGEGYQLGTGLTASGGF